ncbi:Type II secretion system protein G [Pontiella desulfatans]|uniref:Type II secretion system protein G n=1 Tax=Pontiella desulfatans TaxID=2750659 RepID=A0A6C2UC58_PONDE|nr:prepilin-type N-terminal cleavage/methylation domain-containing protein [Pontiella desulfatans]VGO17539.1 Type II secretion system protein G [Pontiella desulfatans]
MKTKKNKKSGFTLVELMVVAIIVAILAAVAIPLMSGNKDRAMATEAQTGCSTIATAMRMHYVEHGNFTAITDPADLGGIKAEADLNGTYFLGNGYTITPGADGNNYTITADGSGDAAGMRVTMAVVDGKTTWTYGETPAP